MCAKENKVLSTRVRDFPDCSEKKPFPACAQSGARSAVWPGEHHLSGYCVVLAAGPEDALPRPRMAFLYGGSVQTPSHEPANEFSRSRRIFILATRLWPPPSPGCFAMLK